MADIYDEEDRKSALIQGLLGAAFPLLGARRGSEFNAFGQAGLLGLNSYNRSLEGATEARDRKAQREQQRLMWEQAQEERALKMQQMQQQREQQAAMQRAAGGAFTGGSPPMGPPTEQGEMQPGVVGQFNPQAYIAALQQHGLPQQAIAAVKEYGPREKKLKDTRTLMQNGRRVTVNMYDDGTHEVLPYAPDAEKLHFGSTGAMTNIGLDPYTGKPVSQGLPATMAPADAARIGIDRARLGLEQQRFAREGQAPTTKPPEGYRWKPDGSVEPIPGGPKDTTEKDAVRTEGALARADLILSKVADATKMVGPTTAGLGGALMANVPGTAAVDLRKTVDTIKSNIGFQELQSMREASPTGGALGQVAVQELNMLQAVISSLDENQSPGKLRESLAQVDRHFRNWKAIVRKAGPQQTTPDQKPQRQVVRTGMRAGRKVVQYADGTIEEQ